MSLIKKKKVIWALSIGGLTIKIFSDPEFASLNAERFQPFQSDSRNIELIIYFHLLEAEALTGKPLDPENDPRLAKSGRRGTDSPLLRSPQVKLRLNKTRDHSAWLFVEMLSETMTVLDFRNNQADFFFIHGSESRAEERFIGPALLAPFLPRYDACLLHAATVVRNGRAAVFLAPDGGGKTTAARLAPAGTILSDDQVLVRRFRDGFRVSGTPWGLHSEAKIQAPLAGLFLLEKAHQFSLNPFAARESVPRIWEEVKNPLSILPMPLKKKAFNLIGALAASVPVRRLSFTPDHIDWQAIDEMMARGKSERKGSD